ncbi:MAG: alpha/beta fold hydrolase [Phycisphaerae bacterium]
MRAGRFAAGVAVAVAVLAGCVGYAAEGASFTRTEDVIYGRKYGTALTMDVFMPKTGANGAAVIYVISGGWFSAHEMINPGLFEPFLSRGYTVFAVVHGSQPKFTIPEVLEDMHRAVRFIRYNAERFRIDPDRISIAGGSAGGHLSLMIGMAGRPGPAKAKDPVDRASSRVQAVACFFPPTDFLNYGEPGRDVFRALAEELGPFRAPFDFVRLDPDTKQLVPVRDEAKRLEIARQISPITHVTRDDPPTLIIHGDADKLVPIQQSEAMKAKLEECGVPVKLVVKPGAGHGWKDWAEDIALFADWFDRYLGRSSATTKPQ